MLTPPDENSNLIARESNPIQDLVKSSNPVRRVKKEHILLAGAVFAFLALLSFMTTETSDENSVSEENNEIFFGLFGCSEDSDCRAEKVCCGAESSFLGSGSCKECCSNYDCYPKISQPPNGEWGKPFCLDNVCESGKPDSFWETSPKIAEDGYQAWAPSETIDNSKVFRGYKVPRILHSTEPTPVMDQVWYIDFNDQRSDFPLNKVASNGTHLMVPIFEHMHSGYSKSYHQYDEHETGISTLAMGDNEYSLVSDYPKTTFVEKYHTLTYSGEKDYDRGNYVMRESEEDVKEGPFNQLNWKRRALAQFVALGRRSSIQAQVEAGIDRVVSWQIRRFVNSHKPEDTGKFNENTSSAWGNHVAKAKEAINLAKNPEFEREYAKSEQHCKHFENKDNIGVSYNTTHVVIPLGRPITTFTGEMVNAPVYYLGLGVGHTTFIFDENINVLQIYYSLHAISRQYSDENFRGPYGQAGTALYVSPVAEGEDYEIDMSIEGRSNIYLEAEQPADDLTMLLPWAQTQANFATWNRPQKDICEEDILDGDWWENVDLGPGNNNIFETLEASLNTAQGAVSGILCAPIWMRTDYGAGAHRFGINEVGVWVHFLGEVRDVYTKPMGAGNYWDNWECFYQNKNYSVCEDRGVLGI